MSVILISEGDHCHEFGNVPKEVSKGIISILEECANPDTAIISAEGTWKYTFEEDKKCH